MVDVWKKPLASASGAEAREAMQKAAGGGGSVGGERLAAKAVDSTAAPSPDTVRPTHLVAK